MAKENQTIFVCSNCGEEYMKWQGKCDICHEWNSLKEFKSKKIRQINSSADSEPVDLDKINIKSVQRVTTGKVEFDRVLGSGGFVPGSVVLLGGDPGIGKSTLLLQVVADLKRTLYISGEESAEQVKIRFDRIASKNKDLKFLSETNLETVLVVAEKNRPDFLVIDSIQTIYSQEFPSTPGSIVQVRESALKLQQFAKSSGTTVILVGHVTKEGTVAGPKMLEHLVDVVLYLEGERFQNTRILRGVKNRFGATDEIGIFEMTEKGLMEISNPSKLFLAERLNEPGSIITSTIEGTRALLVEVQALTSPAVFGYPQRRANGFDLNRLQLIIAVLQKRAGLSLSNQDVFINIVGGFKIAEPAVDLAVALAINSVSKGQKLSNRLCVFGEVGLSGEIRQVNLEAKRLNEARRLGFDYFIKSKSLVKAIEEVKKYV